MEPSASDIRDGLKSIHPTLMKTTGKPNPDAGGLHNGRWTKLEHENFLIGLALYGREWKKVAAQIKTRTSAQVRDLLRLSLRSCLPCPSSFDG